jgi:hypothetical protein
VSKVCVGCGVCGVLVCWSARKFCFYSERKGPKDTVRV